MARPARADLTSWLSTGGGYSFSYNNGTKSYEPAGVFSGVIGVGSAPAAPVVIGGVVRATIRFGLGTDVGLMARGTSGGFSRGDWGLAVDVGVSLRTWTHGVYGPWPIQSVILLGAPWGVQLAVGSDIVSIGNEPPARGGFALLEFDFLRFTLMRQGSTDRWWRNPSPAGGRMKEP